MKQPHRTNVIVELKPFRQLAELLKEDDLSFSRWLRAAIEKEIKRRERKEGRS